MELTMFIASVVLALCSVVIFFLKMRLRVGQWFFWVIPVMFVYYSTICHLLSLIYSVTRIGVFLLQIVTLSVLLFIPDKNVEQAYPLRPYAYAQQKSIYRRIINQLLIAICVVLVGVVGYFRYVIPNYHFDEMSYRASAPLHWIENKSMNRFPTENERKNVFIMGSGMVYMLPLVFGGSEVTGRIIYFAAYPLLLIVTYLFLSYVTEDITVRLLSVVIIASTPLFMILSASTLVQETWLAVVGVCYLYFLYSDLASNNKNVALSCMAGVSLAVLIFIKISAWVYITPLLLYVFLIRKVKNKLWVVLCSFTVTLLATGFFTYLYQNILLYGHPFGSLSFRSIHLADISFIQLLTHAVRFPFLFIEPPLFSLDVSVMVGQIGNSVATFFGATRLLPMEEQNWTGNYYYSLPVPNQHFGLAGCLILIGIIYCLVIILRRKIPSRQQNILVNIFLLLVTGSFIQVLVTRWAQIADIPYRHLLSFVLTSSFAVSIVLSVLRKRRYLYGIVIAYIVLSSVWEIVQFYLTVSPRHVYMTGVSNNDSLFYLTSYTGYIAQLDKPKSFLVVDHSVLLDLPLFWYKGQYRNSIHLIQQQSDSVDQYVQRIAVEFMKTDYDALVVLWRNDVSTMIGEYFEGHRDIKRIILHGQNGEVTIFEKQREGR